MSFAATLRFAGRIAWIVGLILVCVPLHYLSLAVTRRSAWPPRFLRWAARAAGARVRVEGVRVAGPAVLLPNHLSALDIPILAGTTGCTFIAKGELAHAPVVGWLASLNDTVFVARADRLGVAGQVAQVRSALGSGRPVAIFAEGSTGDGSTLRPFKPALLAAIDPPPPGLLVQPVALDYGTAAEEIAWRDAEPGADYARRILSRRSTLPVTVRLLAPVDPAVLPGRKVIAAESHRRVGGALAASRRPDPN